VFEKNNVMITTISSQSPNISKVDALWVLIQSQTKAVRKALTERLLAENLSVKKEVAMKAYESQLSPEVRKAVSLMAVSVRRSAEDVRKAAAAKTHVGRPAEDLLAELEAEFEYVPNAETRAAIEECESGKELETLDLANFKAYVKSL